MRKTGRTWLVLVRDVSRSLQAKDYERTHLALVLDPESKRAFAVSPGPSREAACRFALETALMVPSDPFEPGPPAVVQCTEPDADVVSAEVAALLPGSAVTHEHVDVAPEYEDVFDSIVGMLCGRPQPITLAAPAPSDWRLLHEQALRYRQVEPWKRWSIAGQLSLTLQCDGESTRFLAIVIGDNDTQRGLMMYPGGAIPALHDQGEQTPPPDGTLLFYLDEPDEVIVEYQHRAHRHGWPDDADTMPVLVAGGPDGPGDLDGRSARRLTIAIAAVLEYDANTAATSTSGQVELSDGELAEFTITTAR
jgi:hypothetical protein